MLKNVPVANKDALADNTAIADAVAAAREDMGDDGQVLVRASGTEPLIRVMVEAQDIERAQETADAIAAVVERELA